MIAGKENAAGGIAVNEANKKQFSTEIIQSVTK